MAPKKGDLLENQEEWEKDDLERIKRREGEFQKLLEDIMETEDPNDLPSVVGSRMELMLSMRGFEGVKLLNAAVQNAQESGDDNHVTSVVSACDYILDFTEEFVQQAKSMDDANKKLLGKIIKKIALETNDETLCLGVEVNRSDLQREKDLDELLKQESKNFTPGFLRHVEGECVRIQKAPEESPQSIQLLNTLRIIQARVVEELGKDLGEGAQVLSQLLAYDDNDERIAVLEAGLTIRGIDFAKEISGMTGQALQDFEKMEEGVVDPELVKRVDGLHTNILEFIETRSSWE